MKVGCKLFDFHNFRKNNKDHQIYTIRDVILPGVIYYNELLIFIIILDEVEYDDDEYSVSAQSILQQRRRSGGKSGGGRRRTSFHRGSGGGGRRASSPFPGDEFAGLGRDRRRTSRGGYSVATISSGELVKEIYF